MSHNRVKSGLVRDVSTRVIATVLAATWWLGCGFSGSGLTGPDLSGTGIGLAADEYDRPPINYSTATPGNRVTRLQQELDRGQVRLEHRSEWGYLPDLLKALEISPASQMLVFSKTSLQRQRIHPRTPRALYFNDDVYVGYCQKGDVLEISAVDPQLGMVFYTLEQEEVSQPVFQRETDRCLLCHEGSQARGIPGNLVRSVYPDPVGLPILSSGSFRIDHTSPLEQRWGGWYVTGTHGTQTHLGNLIVRDRREPEEIDNSAGMNVTDLSGLVNVTPYLVPHSDLVALMVLEHQAMAHNLMIQANFGTRQALHYEATLNRELKEPPGKRWQSTTSRIRSVGEPLVKYLLFSGEAPLQGPVQGTSGFADEFVKPGPRDSQGRSLRELDLKTRMFKYPCSYLIYSEAFSQLPAELHEYVYRRMWEVLQGEDGSREFQHLSPEDRAAIREILLETRTGLPDYWKP